MGKYGDISELLVLPGKKGSALVEFCTREAAEMAFAYEKGDLKNPIRLSWIGGVAPVQNKPTMPCTSSSNTDFESLVLRNLRQAEERKRLIEQMEREDAERD